MPGGGPWVVREAVEGDAPAMIAFAKTLLAEPGIHLPNHPDEFRLTVEEEEAVIRCHHARENALFLCARAPDGALVGLWNCFGGDRRATWHAVECGMSVAAGHRRQGVGRALLERGIDWARATGVVTRLQLHVFVENTPAIRLCEAFGFKIEGRRRRAVSRDGRYHGDLLMALLLGQPRTAPATR